MDHSAKRTSRTRAYLYCLLSNASLHPNAEAFHLISTANRPSFLILNTAQGGMINEAAERPNPDHAEE